MTGSYYGKPNKTIHAGNVRCQGEEANLRQCSKTEYALKELLAPDVNVAGVSCVPNADVTVTNAPLSDTNSSTSSNVSTMPTIILAIILAIVLIIGFIL